MSYNTLLLLLFMLAGQVSGFSFEVDEKVMICLIQVGIGLLIGFVVAVAMYWKREWRFQQARSEITQTPTPDPAVSTIAGWMFFVAYILMCMSKVKDEQLKHPNGIVSMWLYLVVSVGPIAGIQFFVFLLVTWTLGVIVRREVMKRFVAHVILCPIYLPWMHVPGFFCILEHWGIFDFGNVMIIVLCSLVIVTYEARTLLETQSFVIQFLCFFLAVSIQAGLSYSGYGQLFHDWFYVTLVVFAVCMGMMEYPPVERVYQLQRHALEIRLRNDETQYSGKILHLNHFGYVWIEIRPIASTLPSIIRMISVSEFESVMLASENQLRRIRREAALNLRNRRPQPVVDNAIRCPQCQNIIPQ